MKAYAFDYNGYLMEEFTPDLCQITELRKAEQSGRELKEGETAIESLPILPAYSTLMIPPEQIEGQRIKFSEGSWVYEEIPAPIPPEPLPELSYAEKRAAEYPSMFEYLDGVVKSHSLDQDVHNEGVAQIEKYIADCFVIKAKYPKPV